MIKKIVLANISLKLEKEFSNLKECTLFYFIAHTDLYLLIYRSICNLLIGVIR